MQNRYEILFDLFQRKGTFEKDMDSFEVVTKIENAVYELLKEVFHPYEITITPQLGPTAPDGIIKMSQNLIFYECLAGTLDRFQAFKVKDTIEYARNEVLAVMYPGQVYSILIVCKDFTEDGIEILKKHLYESVKRPYGISVCTPSTLAKLHELCTHNVKIKDQALLILLSTVGPLTIEQIDETFSSLVQRKGMPFLETPTGPLRASLEYGNIKTQFEGSFDEVWRSINRLLSEIRPSHVESALARIVHREELDRLVDDLEGVLRIAKEGPYFVVPVEHLPNRDKLLLALLGVYVGYKLGILDENSLSIDELCAMTRVRRNVAQVELSYLSRDRLVEITDVGRRKLTTIGVEYIRNEVLPKVKE